MHYTIVNVPADHYCGIHAMIAKLSLMMNNPYWFQAHATCEGNPIIKKMLESRDLYGYKGNVRQLTEDVAAIFKQIKRDLCVSGDIVNSIEYRRFAFAFLSTHRETVRAYEVDPNGHRATLAAFFIEAGIETVEDLITPHFIEAATSVLRNNGFSNSHQGHWQEETDIQDFEVALNYGPENNHHHMNQDFEVALNYGPEYNHHHMNRDKIPTSPRDICFHQVSHPKSSSAHFKLKIDEVLLKGKEQEPTKGDIQTAFSALYSQRSQLLEQLGNIGSTLSAVRNKRNRKNAIEEARAMLQNTIEKLRDYQQTLTNELSPEERDNESREFIDVFIQSIEQTEEHHIFNDSLTQLKIELRAMTALGKLIDLLYSLLDYLSGYQHFATLTKKSFFEKGVGDTFKRLAIPVC